MPYIGRAATNAGSVNYLDDISSGFDWAISSIEINELFFDLGEAILNTNNIRTSFPDFVDKLIMIGAEVYES